MENRKNILFSTTRGWNPGDEFILFGCMHLLRKAGMQYNPIIFNRNPALDRHPYLLNFYSRQTSEKKRRLGSRLYLKSRRLLDIKERDNSFFREKGDHAIDQVVFAGSPSWSGMRTAPIYQLIQEKNLPVLFLGIGTGSHTPPPWEDFADRERAAFEKSLVLTTRDPVLYQTFSHLPQAVHLPCPALFSAPEEKQKTVTSVKEVGIVFSTAQAVTHQNVSHKTEAFLLQLSERIREECPEVRIRWISHYIDELAAFRKLLPNKEIFYSFDAKDYVDLYGQFDCVIGARVHGIGMAASLGVPGVAIAHDGRGRTSEGFLAEMLSPDMDMDHAVKRCMQTFANIEERSKRLTRHRAATEKLYLEHLLTLQPTP